MSTSEAVPTGQPKAVVMHPTGDYYIVKPIDPDQKTSKGLFLPAVTSESRHQVSNLIGVVKAAGPGAMNPHLGVRMPMQAKVGDVIHYTGGGTIGLCDEKGEPILFVRDAHVVCVFENLDPATLKAAPGGGVTLPSPAQTLAIAK